MKLEQYFAKNSHFLFFSDLSKITNKEKFLITIKEIETLIKKLKRKNKNIILPTYNLFFPQTKSTDFSNNNITTGYLNKYLTNKFKFKRTKRPIYNYAVLGPDKQNIIKCKQTTAWGEDSVLKYLIEKDTIGVGINIDVSKFNWMVIHYLEEKYKVPYRFYKTFNGYNKMLKKKVSEKMYVRRLKPKTIESYTLVRNMRKTGNIKEKNFKDTNFSFINLNTYYKLGSQKIKKNILYFCKYEKK